MRATRHDRVLVVLAGAFLVAFGGSQSLVAQSGSQVAVALISGQPVYESELLPLVQAPLRQLWSQEYEIKKRALERLVRQKLVDAQARAKGISPEDLIKQLADSSVGEPSDSEVEAFYLGQRDRFAGSFDKVKRQLRESLKQARLEQRRKDYFDRLWADAEVTILLAPPKVAVSFDPARMQGSPTAPVVIVEFADFECGYCRAVQPTLKGLLAKYAGQVSLAFRDYPLRSIHEQAQPAAEAARCAGEQGKFWEYHDLLFLNDPPGLNAARLTDHARTLNLDTRRFGECLSSGKYRSQVAADLEDGRQVGVAGTPAFFVNGVFLDGAQAPAAFQQIIDAELNAAKRSR